MQNEPQDTKEVWLTFILILVCVASIAMAGYILDVKSQTIDSYDLIKNTFASSVLFLIGLFFVEFSKRMVSLTALFAGVLVGTGLYLIWTS